MPFLGYRIAQKRGDKRYIVGPVGSGNVKVILILLTKMVAMQVRTSIIEVGKPDLLQLLSKLYLDWSRSLILVLQIGFHKLFKQFIGER